MLAGKWSTAADSCPAKTVCIDELKTPTSPAFVLIGTSPTEVERPTTPQDLAISVYNSIKDAGGLPRDFALEVAPYWLFAHSTLKYREYAYPALLPQIGYNATLSLATASSPANVSAGYTDLGVGVRTHVFIATSSKTDKDIKDQEDALAKAHKVTLNAEDLKTEHCAEKPTEGRCPGLLAEQQALGNMTPAEAEEALKATALKLREALASREGVVISLAGALSGRTMAGEKLSWKKPTKAAGWLNVGYLFGQADLLGVARYTRVTEMEPLGFLDLGARASWSWKRYSLFAEGLHRFVQRKPTGSTIESSNRFTGTLEVALTEGVFLSATAGQDVATEDRPSGLLTLLGLSFQASRERTLGK
jgi:hypothetical protein